ncbi:MAG: permease-like cell division protein FtsX [Prevotellaceae bacterium]|jgi:cell division transport system permease protein|nr:permease-like cell division protein FtsX [Prevotellaceae bacterium]
MARYDKNNTIRRLRSSYLSAVVSISLVLFLLGASGLLLLNAHRLSEYFRENITFTIILDESATEADAAWVRKQLDAAPYVNETKYVSKEEAAEEMKSLLGSDFMTVFDANPLPFAVEAKLKGHYAQMDSVQIIEKTLSALPHIREVTYQRSLIEMVNKNIRKSGLVLLVFISLMLFISLVLINNTIRLSIYARRLLINTMRLVGATQWFITRPFLWRSLLQGIFSGVIAIILLTGVLYVAQNEFGEIMVFIEPALLLFLFISIIILGMLISFVSTLFAVNKFVRIDVGDLHY